MKKPSIMICFFLMLMVFISCQYKKNSPHTDAIEFGLKGHPKYVETERIFLDEANSDNIKEAIENTIKFRFTVAYHYNQDGNLDSAIISYKTDDQKQKTIYNNKSNPRSGITIDNQNKVKNYLFFNWTSDTSYEIIRKNPDSSLFSKNEFFLNHHYRDLHANYYEFDDKGQIKYTYSYYNELNSEDVITRATLTKSDKPEKEVNICKYENYDQQGNSLKATLINEKTGKIVELIHRTISYY